MIIEQTLPFDTRDSQAEKKICAVTDCDLPSRSNQLCKHHYNNWYRRGDALSVGRIGREPRHGWAGKVKSPEWMAWRQMKQRYTLTSRKDYFRYGGRGITICERWLQFENFIADMGRKPSSRHSLERKNNDGNYEPSNCVWALPIEQANNRGNSHFLEHNGLRLTIGQWARRLSIRHDTLTRRLKLGWPIERVLTQPVRGTHGCGLRKGR